MDSPPPPLRPAPPRPPPARPRAREHSNRADARQVRAEEAVPLEARLSLCSAAYPPEGHNRQERKTKNGHEGAKARTLSSKAAARIAV